jgi:hypothetical protein
MSVGGAELQRVSFGGLRSALGRLGILWPVLASAVVLLAFAGTEIAADHGNPAALVQFGTQFVRTTHPPAGDPIQKGPGYDGQLYWLQAHDPLLLRRSTAIRLQTVSAGFPLRRPAYPALAWLLAGGQASLLAWSLLAINVIAILSLTAAFAVYARRRGWNPAWAFVIGLSPGIVVSATRDLSDVLATCAMFAGLLAFNRRRAWLAGGLLAVAALAREPMVLSAVAVALALTAECWRSRSLRGAAAIVRRGWPAVALPVAAYVGWGAYLRTLPPSTGTGGATGDTPIFPPFRDFYVAAQHALASGSVAHILFVLPYLALTAGAIVLALWMLRRGRTAALWMTVLYGVLVMPTIFLTDGIALTRYTAPLFLCLMLAGLENRSRPAIAIAAGATAMTFLLPILAY